MPLILAGSAAGPTMMKSLYMTALRSTPKPLSMKVFSAAGEWTSSTSASPVSPSFKASPLPTATTLTVYCGYGLAEGGDQDVEETGILRRRCRREHQVGLGHGGRGLRRHCRSRAPPWSSIEPVPWSWSPRSRRSRDHHCDRERATAPTWRRATCAGRVGCPHPLSTLIPFPPDRRSLGESPRGPGAARSSPARRRAP